MEQQGTERGLKSEEAFLKLRAAITEELKEYDVPKPFHKQMFQDCYDGFHQNLYMPINWFGILLLTASGGVLLYGYVLGTKYLGHGVLLEGIILIVITMFIIIFVTREEALRRTETLRRIQQLLENMQCIPDWSFQSYPLLHEPFSNAIKMVWTYRDGNLVNLPWNLLVEGDIILLGPSHLAPAYIKQVSSHSCVPLCLDAGEVFNPPSDSTKNGVEDGCEPAMCQPHPRESFVVMETPVKRYLRGALQKGGKRPQSVVNSDMKQVCHVIRTKLFWGVVIVAFFANYIRWRIIPEAVGHFAEVLLLGPVYAVLPLIPASFPFLWILCTFYGTARIRTLFTMSVQDLSSDDGDEDFSTKLEHIPHQKVIAEFVKILKGVPDSLSRTANLLHALGNTSIFCCTDKEGILCFPNPIPEKVFILKNRSKMSSSVAESEDCIMFSSKDDSGVEGKDLQPSDSLHPDEGEAIVEEHSPEVLNLSFDPTDRSGVCFDDPNWEEYITSLKPLGLNILMNSPCTSPYKNAQIEDFTGHISLGANNSPLPNIRRCLCLFAQTMGFDDTVAKNFSKLAQITTFRPVHAMELANVRSNFFLSIIREKQVPSMVSVVTSDRYSGMIQLLTQGSANIVLDACSDFWDGEELCEITSEDRKKALDFHQRMNITGHCVAFAYRPVFEFSSELQGSSIFLQYPSSIPISPSEDCDDTCSNWSLSQYLEESMNSLTINETISHKDCQPCDLTHLKSTFDDSNGLARMLKRQIFIGMVTLQDLVKEDVASLVEELDNGGIRFVHFSYENELRSRVFAERLGLETGWNCHISLSECEDQISCDRLSTCSDNSERDPLLKNQSDATLDRRDTSKTQSHEVDDEEDQEQGEEGFGDFFFISNRAKLPRGIRNIRPHLEKVDDVPLLVPLFTDCTPQGISEMISIMQEHGETVCCIGSALNMNNADIFCQADLSIALEPLHPQQCLMGKVDNFRCGSPPVRNKSFVGSMGTSITDLMSSPLAMAAQLTAIPCSLSCHRNDKIKFVHLICEARRILVGMRHAFHFLLSSCLALSAMMILSFALLLPFPLTGCQLLWLLLVMLPIISLSLIGTPAERELMSGMPGKRSTDMKENVRQFLQQFIPTFFTSGCFSVAVIFSWSLFSICQRTSTVPSRCHYLLGDMNSTDPWHGFGGSMRSGLIIAQEVNLFFVVLFFVTLSASYVHRTKQLWKKSPFVNKPWWVSSLACIFMQILYTMMALLIRGFTVDGGLPSPFKIHFGVYIVGFLWPFVIIALSERTKRRFIRIWQRFQRRERLKFDTKLGMNSPV